MEGTVSFFIPVEPECFDFWVMTVYSRSTVSCLCLEYVECLVKSEQPEDPSGRRWSRRWEPSTEWIGTGPTSGLRPSSLSSSPRVELGRSRCLRDRRGLRRVSQVYVLVLTFPRSRDTPFTILCLLSFFGSLFKKNEGKRLHDTQKIPNRPPYDVLTRGPTKEYFHTSGI